MLCGELLNGGFVSAGAVPAVPYGLLGLWIPGCVRATSPRLLTSPYLTLVAELLATGSLDQQQLQCQNLADMDLVRLNQHLNTNNQSADLDLDLDNDESVFLENGLLSFENPNYHLESARFDDALNSNGTANSLFDEFYPELVVSGGRRDEVTGGIGSGGTRPARRFYCALNLGSMGVDVTQGPLTQNSVTAETPDNTANHNLGYGSEGADVAESTLVDDNLNGNSRPSSTALSNVSVTLDAGGSDLRNYCEKADNDLTEMGGVPHVEDGLNSDVYSVPVKRRQPKDQIITNQSQNSTEKSESPGSEDKDENLPAGWEKHEDKDGPYYWHIKSGTIQREPPEASLNSKTENRRSLVKDNDSINNFHTLGNIINTVTRSNTSSALDQEAENKRKEELALKRRSFPARADSEGRDKPIRFAVRSLGWTEIAEEDLTPERSSKAVNKCIVDLSLGRNDLLDVVGRWGDGKDLFMDLDEGALKLIDPENLTVLNTQPIHTLRVWGVGRDHGRERDFAYVARDRSTRKFMCHVFRCDIPARTIANTLRDICKKIMIERSLHQNLAKPVDINGRTSLATRPTNLPTEHRRFHRNDQPLVTQSFPTPMEEPKKVLRAQYLGSMQVTAATGMEILNDAIDHMVTNTPINQWRNVNVAVAPSMISILTPNDEKLITECRVRYLSFLGIGRNVKQCAFIMHTAQDLFIAHIFNCEPSSGALCKTIEAACKLRYQKCLDAHPQGFRNANNLSTPSGRGIGATLKSLVGSLTGRRNKQSES
ncbi:protein Fe65 homolog isoform X1 [Chelonus insularis]|uniref:protein Fe65 homolog isoform X1 n=1 Tax=Chelonus insularis TaxID=460826 RepID=UPI00158DA841|nr:protein Fe65 homolog isoform X1 [Chelonus insularis]XP_034938068.1 protein Fe65 homolog isoform X1 [Chelonus insularis]XP_034938069.1 protein Fe65 homolog isoform X1 [Chelonus insularis]XP_034938070.1 protein Fe65 homolog isoform X1 [Chelonus insularis]XP_034938071.1 protein Fe65 homolog isoform X1 [Chelonus insularis]